MSRNTVIHMPPPLRKGFDRGLGLAIIMLCALFACAGPGRAGAEVGPLVLPDGRAWEQVSPVDKAGTDVHQGGAMAAIDGNRLLFRAQGAFAGAQTALNLETLSYMATRTSQGWKTTSIAPPGGVFSLGWNGYQGFSPDLARGVTMWGESRLTGTIDSQAPFGFNLYLRDTATGSFQLLNGPLDHIVSSFGFVWGSSDFGKLAIDSSQGLTLDSPCNGAFQHCAYEWDDGDLRLASILPNGEPVKGGVGSLGHRHNFEHALSDDGSRLFFASGNGLQATALYVRENGTTTTFISGSERTLPGGVEGKPIYYQSAEAAHGNRVIFTTENSLVDADSDATNDLYMYEFTAPVGKRLTLVSEDENPEGPDGAVVNGAFGSSGGVIAASEDLRRIYFVADNQIIPGEPSEAGPKLYLWDDTGSSAEVRYIATLEKGDAFAWVAPAIDIREGTMREARSSRDGRLLAFISAAQLTGFDNEGRREVYLYDAAEESLECISCTADAFPADGEIRFNFTIYGAKPVNHLLKNVSEANQVFFETTRGLLPRDSNGKFDVYEYEDGQLHLISTGTGKYDSFFLDATPSGSDVFFATRDRLVGWDVDDNYDVYDARVGGGLPEPPLPLPLCEGDSCQAPPQVPLDPSLSSASFHGADNAGARKPRRRCGAGKVRRGGKCRNRRAKAMAGREKRR